MHLSEVYLSGRALKITILVARAHTRILVWVYVAARHAITFFRTEIKKCSLSDYGTGRQKTTSAWQAGRQRVSLKSRASKQTKKERASRKASHAVAVRRDGQYMSSVKEQNADVNSTPGSICLMSNVYSTPATTKDFLSAFFCSLSANIHSSNSFLLVALKQIIAAPFNSCMSFGVNCTQSRWSTRSQRIQYNVVV